MPSHLLKLSTMNNTLLRHNLVDINKLVIKTEITYKSDE